jgi:hypothetical protein
MTSAWIIPPGPQSSELLKGEAILSCLSLIDEVTAQVCRRHRLSPDESEDFRSQVRLHFSQRDFEPLRRFEGRCSLRTYLTVVICRLFLGYRKRLWGKWLPSAVAKRLIRYRIVLSWRMYVPRTLVTIALSF